MELYIVRYKSTESILMQVGEKCSIFSNKTFLLQYWLDRWNKKVCIHVKIEISIDQ